MTIRIAFLCVLQLILSTSTFAQEAPVTQCDTYAASDLDPQRKATGVPTDKINPALAIPACETAVRQFPDSTRLLSQLGRAYYKANNFTAALVQFRKAAERNYAPAQSNLGTMYMNGQGIPKDDAQALFWLRKSADQNYAPAQNNLGVMYQSGAGVPKDIQMAIAWYRKAAEQGNPLAQESLKKLASAASQQGQTGFRPPSRPSSPNVGGQFPTTPPSNTAGPTPSVPMTPVAPNVAALPYEVVNDKAVVEVTGVGATLSEARMDAIRLALQRTMQQLVVVDRLIKDDKVVTDKIYSTLNGYIENFKVLEKSQETNLVTIKAEVTVSPTRIVSFAKVIGGTTTEIPGDIILGEAQREIEARVFVAKCSFDYFEDFLMMHSIYR